MADHFSPQRYCLERHVMFDSLAAKPLSFIRSRTKKGDEGGGVGGLFIWYPIQLHLLLSTFSPIQAKLSTMSGCRATVDTNSLPSDVQKAISIVTDPLLRIGCLQALATVSPNRHIIQAVAIGDRFCHWARKPTDTFRKDKTAQTPLCRKDKTDTNSSC